MKTNKNIDFTIRRILKEIISENVTPEQKAALDAGFGPVTDEEAKRLQIPYPSGISKPAIDKILSISNANKKALKGSYLFPMQQQEIDKEFGQGTYDKFYNGGGKDVLDRKKFFKPQNTVTTPPTTQQKQVTTPPTTQQKQVTSTSKFGVDYKYNYPGDKAYVYGYKDGKWYTKNVAKGVEFDLSTNPKWKSSIDNLNKQFAAQIKTPTPTPTPVVQLYQNQYQTQRDNTYVRPLAPPQFGIKK